MKKIKKDKSTIIIYLLIIIIIISGCFLGGYWLVVNYDVLPKISQAKTEEKKVTKTYSVKDVSLPLIYNNYIAETDYYKGRDYEIKINNDKKVSVTLKDNSSFIISDINNAKSIVINENKGSYFILTEEGNVYGMIGCNIEYMDNGECNFSIVRNSAAVLISESLNNDELKFDKVYANLQIDGAIALGKDGIYYKLFGTWITGNVTTPGRYVLYDLNEKYSSLHESIMGDNVTGDIYIPNDDNMLFLNEDGIVSSLKYKNKLLLPDGTEPKVYKMFINRVFEDDISTSFILYVITTDNKMYSINYPKNMTVSTKLELTEIQNGQRLSEISYSIKEKDINTTKDYDIYNLKFIFDDGTDFTIKNITISNTLNILEREK